MCLNPNLSVCTPIKPQIVRTYGRGNVKDSLRLMVVHYYNNPQNIKRQHLEFGSERAQV